MTHLLESRNSESRNKLDKADTADAHPNKIFTWSVEQLHEVVSQCERAISDGSADIGDFELFVRCRQDLARRSGN
ncbi:MAG: hypothetical protein U5L04_10205 [Trueperaceae bacterium]|nr:hypothetical protein [Trueperaceae bacterium]